ncbi:hypothetical protein K8I85_11425 [bacterium]|nr:hypothetical protein [bacterium]
MKLATSIAALMVLCMCSAAFAVNTTNSLDLNNVVIEKDAAVSGIHTPVINVGGDNIGSAAPIPVLPYTDGGNTCSFLNDYDEVCPFSGSSSPDVVYSYTPGANGAIDVSLCDSFYDTKVYVYENSTTTLVGCNDDACGSDGFRSALVGVPVTAGNTYYIVVDGYGGACGDYALSVSENVPCIIDCPPGAMAEGEVDCFDDYNDNYNAGCNATPNVFTNIACQGGGATVCGTYGGYFHPSSGFNYRDTDWYSMDAGANAAGITWCVTGQYDTLAGYLSADAGCGAPAFVESQVVGPCVTACFNLPAGGNYWLFVGTSAFGPDAGACGGAYTMTLDNMDCPVSVEQANWSQIKADYR